MSQGESGSGEAEVMEISHRVGGEGPRDGEYGAHRDTDGTAVEGVAGIGGEDNGVDTHGRGGTEDGSDIGGVGDALEHGHNAGVAADVGDRGESGTGYGAEDTSSEGIAGDRGEEIARAGVDGHIGASGDDIGGVTHDMSGLAEHGEWHETMVDGDTNHLGTLGDEKTMLCLVKRAELRLGHRAEEAEDLMVWIVDFYYHGAFGIRNYFRRV